METVDHSTTFALLIGTSEFPRDSSINAIPNVKANIEAFRASLIDSDVIGIPAENITVSVNESKSDIERKLRDTANMTRLKKNTLLVYYTGHGIMSSEDYKLYLTTVNTSKSDLEIEGINIEDFKKYVKRSAAGRKIVILDCCHSGAVIGSMNTMASNIQAGLTGFEGTYVMTSAAEDEPALFPHDNPNLPTYFTGKLLDVVNEGLDLEQEYCSLHDIFGQIRQDFEQTPGMSTPQQSNYNNADQIIFSRNKKYLQRKSPDELAWREATKANTMWAYVDFRRQFPDSVYAKEAKQRSNSLEEDDLWKQASGKNTVSSYDDYLEKYPVGRYAADAENNLQSLRHQGEAQQKEKEQRERKLWADVLQRNNANAYGEYLRVYPNGVFSSEAKRRLDIIGADAEQRRNADIDTFVPPRPFPPAHTQTKRSNIGKWLMIGGGALLGIILLKFIINSVSHTSNEDYTSYNPTADTTRIALDSAVEANQVADEPASMPQTTTTQPTVQQFVGTKSVFNRTENVEVDNTTAADYYNRGVQAGNSSDYETAISYMTQALQIAPQFSEAYHDRGLANYYLKRYNAALLDFNNAIALNPNYGTAYYYRAMVLASMGRPDEELCPDVKQAAMLGVNIAQWLSLLCN